MNEHGLTPAGASAYIDRLADEYPLPLLSVVGGVCHTHLPSAGWWSISHISAHPGSLPTEILETTGDLTNEVLWHLYWAVTVTTHKIAERMGLKLQQVSEAVGPYPVFGDRCNDCDGQLVVRTRMHFRELLSGKKSPWCAPCQAESLDHRRDIRMSLARAESRHCQTPHWQALKERKKAATGGRCQLCNTLGKLDLHHRTYERAGAEEWDDVIALCKTCHMQFHKRRGLVL